MVRFCLVVCLVFSSTTLLSQVTWAQTCNCSSPTASPDCECCVNPSCNSCPCTGGGGGGGGPTGPSSGSGTSKSQITVTVSQVNAVNAGLVAFGATLGVMGAHAAVNLAIVGIEALMSKLGHPISKKDKAQKAQDLANYQTDLENFSKTNEQISLAANHIVFALAALEAGRKYGQSSDIEQQAKDYRLFLRLEIDEAQDRIDADQKALRTVSLDEIKSDRAQQEIDLEDLRDQYSKAKGVGGDACEALLNDYRELVIADGKIGPLATEILDREQIYWDWRKSEITRLGSALRRVTSSGHEKKIRKGMTEVDKNLAKIIEHRTEGALRSMVGLCTNAVKEQIPSSGRETLSAYEQACQQFVARAILKNPASVDHALNQLESLAATEPQGRLATIKFFALDSAEASANNKAIATELDKNMASRLSNLRQTAALVLGLNPILESQRMIAETSNLNEISFVSTIPALRERADKVVYLASQIEGICTKTKASKP